MRPICVPVALLLAFGGARQLAAQSSPPQAWAGKYLGPNSGGLVASYSVKPGETVSGFGRGDQYEGTAKVTKVSVYLQDALISEATGMSNSLWANFVAIFPVEGEFVITVSVMDSGGQTNLTRAGVRVSNDHIEAVFPNSQPWIAGDTISVGARTYSAFIMQGVRIYGVAEWSAAPFKALWTIPRPGVFQLSANGAIFRDPFWYVYESPIQSFNVLPPRLPYVQGLYIPPKGVGDAVTITPLILSRGETHFQWMRDGIEVPGATEPTLTLSSLTAADAGCYLVHVENFAGGISAEVANITLTNAVVANGAIWFSSRTPNVNVQIKNYYPADTFLGPTARAQLYAGTSIANLKAVGPILTFKSGYFRGGAVAIPGVAPGEDAVTQVAVWDNQFGTFPTFEVARQNMAPWWCSKILKLKTTTMEAGGAELIGLEPFTLMVWDGYGLYTWLSTTGSNVTAGATVQMIVAGQADYTWTGVTVTNLQFEWTKDGKVLPGMTQSNLTLVNVQPKDAGIYRVAATAGVSINTMTLILAVDSGIPILRASSMTDGAVLWRLDSTPGTTTSVQTSMDLINWSTWQRFGSNPSGVWFSNVFTGLGKGFVRAVVE